LFPCPVLVPTIIANFNIFFRILQRNISSALIVEDDVDWEVRIKS
jgi:hypothetical protein